MRPDDRMMPDQLDFRLIAGPDPRSRYRDGPRCRNHRPRVIVNGSTLSKWFPFTRIPWDHMCEGLWMPAGRWRRGWHGGRRPQASREGTRGTPDERWGVERALWGFGRVGQSAAAGMIRRPVVKGLAGGARRRDVRGGDGSAVGRRSAFPKAIGRARASGTAAR